MEPPKLERIAPPAHPERIAVFAADASAERALGHLRSTEGVRFIRAWNTDRASAAVLRIGLADVRLPGGTARLIKSRRLGAVSVAVVAIDPAHTSTELARLDRVFDSVLVVPIGPEADAELPLARATRALTASCTGDRVCVAVEELRPFLADGGRLRHGAAEAPSVADAVPLALAAARLDRSTPDARIQLHIATPGSDLRAELKDATWQLELLTRFDDVVLSMSSSEGANRTVSVVAAVTPSKRPAPVPF